MAPLALRRRWNALPFAATLAAALFVGNIVFHGTFYDTSLAIPHHVLDVSSLIAMTIALPLSAVWMVQIFEFVSARTENKSLFWGLATVAAVLAVVMTAVLLGLLGWLNEIALLQTSAASGANLNAYASQDLNNPLALIDLANVWNSQWMGALLPSFALAGALIVLYANRRTRMLARGRQLLVLVTPFAAALVTAGLFWLVADVFGVIETAKHGNWYAAQLTAFFVPALAGMSIAALCALMSTWFPPPRVVLAAGCASVASLLAMIMIDAFWYQDFQGFWTVAGSTAPIALLGAMIASSLLGPRRLPTYGIFAATVASATAIMLVGLACVPASTATVGEDIDATHYETILFAEMFPDGKTQNGPLADTIGICTASPKVSNPKPVAELIDEYSGPLWRPATASVKAIHMKLLDALLYCEDSRQRAFNNGWDSVTESEMYSTVKRFTAFQQAAKARFG
jgi:hypothetical protein